MEIQKNIPLAPYTTLRVGGTSDFFIEVDSVENLNEAISFAEERKLPLFILGGGSNVLISDDGFRGLTIKNAIRGVNFEEDKVEVGAGEVWDDFVQETIKRNLFGIENLAAIPGTVGATPIQNVGAYGQEVGDVIDCVEFFDTSTMTINELKASECLFSYRSSIFKRNKNLIITKVIFQLSRRWQPNISYKDLKDFFSEKQNPSQEEVAGAVQRIRAKKFPDTKKFGTAGSFFKNPILSYAEGIELQKKYPAIPVFETSGGVKVSLAWILDNVLHKKGFREGNVALFENQPLVLIHKDATSFEIKKFAEKIKKEVKEKINIAIECEVNFL